MYVIMYRSIQTILKFAKWINTIYIVTDNQIPPIQQELISSGKVVIIDHKDVKSVEKKQPSEATVKPSQTVVKPSQLQLQKQQNQPTY